MRVLIADDSPLVVDRVSSVLAAMGRIEVVGRAGTVLETASAVRDLKPDVMILDLQMPDGSGLDVLQGIARDPSAPVVIVLTNHGTPQHRRKCLQSGAHFFLDKSVEFDKLPEVLRTLNAHVSAMRSSAADSRLGAPDTAHEENRMRE